MFKRIFSLVAVAWFASTAFVVAQDDRVIQFDFTKTSDASGQYEGTLHNGAVLTTYYGHPILDLGTDDGYFDFGTQLGELIGTLDTFAISVNVFIPSDADLSRNGNFVWCFARSSSEGYLMFSAKDNRYSITTTDYTGETSLYTDSPLTPGRWNNIVYWQSGPRRGRLFLNRGLKTTTVAVLPKDIGPTLMNYIGRSCYAGDAFLKGAKIADFRIYTRTLANSEPRAIANLSDTLNIYAQYVEDSTLIAGYNLDNTLRLMDDIVLPTKWGRATIEWSTSNPAVITDAGHITRPVFGSPVAEAVLTAHLTCGEAVLDKQFAVSVLPEFSDEQSLAYDVEKLTLEGHLNNLYNDLALPTVGALGSVITWESSDPAYLSATGKVLQYAKDEKRPVTLTATLYRGNLRETKTFDIHLHQQEPYSKYLFVYFPSNDNENLYYAISDDGYNYTPLNNGQAFLKADTTSVMGGLRDPHILRGEDGWFYMAVTDMRCALGWSSNRGLVLMKSRDLIHWQHSTVHFPTRYAGTSFARVTRVWAPQTIYDHKAGKYMVYFSLLTDDGSIRYDKDYYCYANADFTDFEGEPQYFYDRGSATIDMDIVYNETDSLYHGFFKNEGEGGICQVTARSLTPEPGQRAGSQWSRPSGKLQQTNVGVEGAGVFKLINQDSWVLMYDCYNSGYYQFCSSPDLNSFQFVQNTTTSGAFTPRHGTVIPITAEEAAMLLAQFPVNGLKPAVTGAANIAVKQSNYALRQNKIYVPVEAGTDISSFDPQLQCTPGTILTPSGAQDFSAGPVAYTATLGDQQVNYEVTVEACGNPIIPGYHADPEVLFSRKTGRFYVYPTTDGYTGWGGWTFNVFSSPDLLHFTDAGTILNCASGKDVPWASGNAWAPCIEEKIVDGKWRYYFYFSANNASQGRKTLGVATAESPEGPFKASTRLVVTSTSGGQMIDSDVFTDPISGQSYLYYGNGQMHYRLLTDDMMSTQGTEYTITPAGGSLADFAYREGTYVFYRNGLYYFLWSVDDTGAANYHVAYGTSTSPTGPIKVAAQPIVIIQKPDQDIYGTGHNSIVNVPGTDDWYIVYHRINKNFITNNPGVHREVCVDKLTFNADGTIAQVTPTRQGISPVQVDAPAVITGIETARDGMNPAAGTRILQVRYYNLSGACLGTTAPTQHGVYVRQELLSDGSARSIKIGL